MRAGPHRPARSGSAAARLVVGLAHGLGFDAVEMEVLDPLAGIEDAEAGVGVIGMGLRPHGHHGRRAQGVGQVEFGGVALLPGHPGRQGALVGSGHQIDGVGARGGGIDTDPPAGLCRLGIGGGTGEKDRGGHKAGNITHGEPPLDGIRPVGRRHGDTIRSVKG